MEKNHYECLARLNLLLLHLLQLATTSCWLLGSFRSLLRVGETVWLSPHEPERVFRQPISTSAAMKVCAQRRIKYPAGFPPTAFLLRPCHNGPSWHYLNILKLFMAVESDFTKSLWRSIDGVRGEINSELATSILVTGGGGGGGWSKIFGKWTAL